jgi:hypothetical protein
MILVGVCAIQFIAPKFPAWMDWTIAGYALKYDEVHSPITIHDHRSGYYLVRAVDCDGAYLSLYLTKDKKFLKEIGTDLNEEGGQRDGDSPIAKNLPALKTGKGISIGDTPTQIRHLLGKPTSEIRDRVKKSKLKLTYRFITGKNDDAVTYEETYSFQNGKLAVIAFYRSSGD